MIREVLLQNIRENIEKKKKKNREKKEKWKKWTLVYISTRIEIVSRSRNTLYPIEIVFNYEPRATNRARDERGSLALCEDGPAYDPQSELEIQSCGQITYDPI